MGVPEELAALREAQPHLVLPDYDGLGAAVASRDPDAALSRLRGELDKVNDVAMVQWEVLSTELRKQLRKDVADNFETLENLAQAVVQLHAYVRLTHEALMGIVRKCGEQEETASCVWFASRVEAAPFRQLRFDTLLAQLGRLYAAWRARRGPRGTAAAPPSAEGTGPEKVFFVPSNSTMMTKVALLKQLAPAAREVRIPTTSATRSTGNFSYDFHRKVSEVFFDNAAGDQYAERYRRNLLAEPERPPASLLQCSWLTEGERDSEVCLTMEDGKGGATEAQLPHREMPGLLAGTLDAAAVAAKGGASAQDRQRQQAALEAASAAIKAGLRPSVSASCLRYSYVADSDGGAAEVATLDEDLVLRDEAAVSGRDWCLAAGGRRAEEAFQGAVLRLRLPAAAAAQLLESLGGVDLRPVPGFSAALHGTALFHRQLAVPPPPWIPSESLPPSAGSSFLTPELLRPGEAEEAVAKPRGVSGLARQISGESPKQPAAGAADLSRRAWRCFPRTRRAVVKPPERKLFVDVKTPLASERTLARWFRSAVLLASLSGLLMAGHDRAANINGFLLGLASLAFIAVPARQFWRRSLEFAQPESAQPRVDRRLPTVLAWVLAAILLATLMVELLLREAAAAVAT